jgi:hypothetical protein
MESGGWALSVAGLGLAGENVGSGDRILGGSIREEGADSPDRRDGTFGVGCGFGDTSSPYQHMRGPIDQPPWEIHALFR